MKYFNFYEYVFRRENAKNCSQHIFEEIEYWQHTSNQKQKLSFIADQIYVILYLSWITFGPKNLFKNCSTAKFTITLIHINTLLFDIDVNQYFSIISSNV